MIQLGRNSIISNQLIQSIKWNELNRIGKTWIFLSSRKIGRYPMIKYAN